MSAEKIIQQIKKDSEKEIKQIQKETEKQVKQIIEDAQKEAKTEADKRLTNGKTESENIKKIMVSKAHQDAKREIMNAEEKIIEECFVEAYHKLSILKGKEYEKLVTLLIKDGQKKLGPSCTTLVTRDEDRKIAEKLGIPVSGRTESFGGVILKSEDGRITLDHTFDGIVRRKKDRIRIKVGKLLFSN